ncbi:MAG: 4Fe-4S binding protein [Spirochaetota bacterium]|nr:4Fe-4S binding protein [Spirochaetota bacterium]
MIELQINEEWCKGCELCIYFCPKECLSMGDQLNTKGFRYPLFNDENCTGCSACGKLCPNIAISIYKHGETSAN